MRVRSSIALASVVVVGWLAVPRAATAQNFDTRWWSPIPKAHADEAPRLPGNWNGTWPDPKSSRGPTQRSFIGKASYYAYRGGKTASGAPFQADGLTAAHRTLPFGTRLRVTDLKSHRNVVVVVTDRGPASRRLVLDISLGAAKALGVTERGIIQIRAEVLGS